MTFSGKPLFDNTFDSIKAMLPLRRNIPRKGLLVIEVKFTVRV